MDNIQVIGKSERLAALSDPQDSLFVLGYIAKDPDILADNKYTLGVTDFYSTVDQMIFASISNIVNEGGKPSSQEVKSHLIKNGHSIIAEQNNELIEKIFALIEIPDKDTFEMHYREVKKYSLLREYEKNGIDTTFLTGNKSDFLNKANKFKDMTQNDIVEAIRNRVSQIESTHELNYSNGSQSAAEGINALIEELKLHPEIGLELDGEIYNYTTRGARLGKLYIYSANSGGGKTRHMVGNACSLSLPYINDKGNVVVREDLRPVLFIPTEMQADEIQTLVLAWISGVDEERIVMGDWNEEEGKRIYLAARILNIYQNNFIISILPEVSISKLKAICTHYILHENIEYIFFDYIGSSVGLMEEFRDINLREDVVLMLAANSLKEIASQYNVFVMTATQLTGDGHTKKCKRDVTMIRGSKSIADKADVGVIGVRIPQEEMEEIQKYCNTLTGLSRSPNIVIDVYKNRRGKMCDIKIFRYFDYATCRAKDLFLTTANWELKTDYKILRSPKAEKKVEEVVGNLEDCYD